MKKLIKLYMMVFLAVTTNACMSIRAPYGTPYLSERFSYARYIDGYWGETETAHYQIRFYYNDNSISFIIHHPWEHPSNYTQKIVIDTRTEKEKDGVFSYKGTMEYYIRLPFSKNNDFIQAYPNLPFRNSPNIMQKKENVTIQIKYLKINQAHKGNPIYIFRENSTGLVIAP